MKLPLLDGPDALDALPEVLAADGMALVRGRDLPDAAALAAVRDELGWEPVPSRDEFADRDRLADGVWSSPQWAADREMCLHHERSYSDVFPRRLLMTALQRPGAGGHMLLADTAAVLDRLPDRVAERFASTGWRLVRSYLPYLGLAWTTAFGTDDPEQVEAYCAAHAMTCGWQRDGSLRVGQVRPAVVTDADGSARWFNQVAFFSRWSVDPEEREVLLSSFGPHGLPFDTGHGDGGELTEPDFRAVLDAYDAVAVTHEWGPDELLVIDNVRVAHGRTPYTGTRLVAVAPTTPTVLADLAPAGQVTAGEPL